MIIFDLAYEFDPGIDKINHSQSPAMKGSIISALSLWRDT